MTKRLQNFRPRNFSPKTDVKPIYRKRTKKIVYEKEKNLIDSQCQISLAWSTPINLRNAVILRACLYYTDSNYTKTVRTVKPQWANHSTHTRVAQCAELLIVSWVVVVTREVTAFNTPHAHSLCKCKHTPVVACRRLKDGMGGRHGTRPTHFQVPATSVGEQVPIYIQATLYRSATLGTVQAEDKHKLYPQFTDPFKPPW